MEKKISLSALTSVMKVYYNSNKDQTSTAEICNLSPDTITRYFRHFRTQYPKAYAEYEEKMSSRLLDDNGDLIENNVKYNKQKQKAQDINRIERKSFREHARIENAIEEYGKAIYELLKKHNNELIKTTIKHKNKKDDKSIGIIQLSDLHLNELVDLQNNKFDFDIASKRLKKYADETIKLFKDNNIKTAIICFTGDLLNSDRRLDELLNQSVNRAKASILSIYILKQFIVHINQHFNVKVFGVVGNEGRMNEEMTWSSSALSDNYDYTILANLKIIFENCNGIEFGSIDQTEQIIQIADKNILLIHGMKFGNQPEKDVTKTKTRYIAKNVMIDYVLFGHLHNCLISDGYARSSSLVGSNSYNEHALNLSSRSSQNCFIVNKTNINGIRIDLQDVKGYDGYDIIEELKSSEAKSVIKSKEKGATIFKVVI